MSRRLTPQFLATAGVYGAALACAMLWGFAYKAVLPWAALKTWVLVAGAVGIILLGLSIAAFVTGWLRATGPTRNDFRVPLVANVIVLALCAGALEFAARMVSKPHQLGTRIGATALIPYDWRAVAVFNQALLQRSRSASSYYVDDAALGWAIGPARQSSNGMYASSTEGLRSARPGEQFLATNPDRRVAIFGDSFAFSEEVPFDQSFGVHVERRLGAGTQALTFGVPGYGIDQAVLLFEREAPRWKPDVSVLQFISDDIDRMGRVYLFNKHDWAYPFVKPRFVLRDGALAQVTLPTPDAVYASRSVFDLPHLDLDSSFDAGKWRGFPLSSSYVVRFAAARSPNHIVTTPVPAAPRDEDLAVAMIERFVAAARSIDSVPVVVYFPDGPHLDGRESASAKAVMATLAAKGISVLDPTACMKEAGGVKELIVGGGVGSRPVDVATTAEIAVGNIDVALGVHYSNAGNDRMAECMLPLLRDRLASRSPRENKL